MVGEIARRVSAQTMGAPERVRPANRGMLRAGAAALAVIAILAGCSEEGLPGTGGSASSVELVERDVEAPEIFHTTASGLWDGRPSLGGVWVAHPDVSEPERVIIRNEDNGKFVIGALFRRERDNPGPALQVSSDAAETLGMLAGAPANLNVTALRREEAAQPAPTPESSPEATPDSPVETPLAAAEGITTQTLDGAPAAAPEAAASPSLPPAPAPAAASSLDKPYIQLGIFSVEANARSLAEDMTTRGMPARVASSTVQGSPFWRVIVGPAGSEAQRSAYLDQVKAQGFADAYFVRN